MTAWLIAALERLPPRVRRIVAAVVALVLIGAAITASRIPVVVQDMISAGNRDLRQQRADR